MPHHNKITIGATIIMLLSIACASTAKQRTTRTKLRTESDAVTASTIDVATDTISGDTVANMLKISGYEKPLRSHHETMLVTNTDTTHTVTSVTLSITYLDMSGRTLHARSATANINLPAGATRLLDLKSWDINTLFYYHLNPPTRTTTQGTPYRVTITPTTATITK